MEFRHLRYFLVLAEELSTRATPEEAFQAFRARRFDRCRYIVETSKAVCFGQLGKGPRIDVARSTHEMFQVTSAPI